MPSLQEIAAARARLAARYGQASYVVAPPVAGGLEKGHRPETCWLCSLDPIPGEAAEVCGRGRSGLRGIDRRLRLTQSSPRHNGGERPENVRATGLPWGVTR